MAWEEFIIQTLAAIIPQIKGATALLTKMKPVLLGIRDGINDLFPGS